MSALLLLVTVALLLVLALVALVRTRRARAALRDIPVRLTPVPDLISVPALSLEDAFEPDCLLLWYGQLALLQFIARAGENGVPIDRVRPLYKRAAARFPELYEGSTFEQWLRFDEAARLICRNDASVWITRQGIEFLKRFHSNQWSAA